MKKRGVTQVDWVISLGVFVLFLLLFFLLVRPVLFPPTEVTGLTDKLNKGFRDSVEWQILKTPLFVENETDFFIVDHNTVDEIIKVEYVDDFTAIVYTTNNENLTDYLNETVVIGLPMIIKGLSLDKMNNLTNISSLKLLWDIPENVDFSIEVLNSTNTLFIINSSVPYDSDNVFVEKHNDFILTDEAELETVEVFLRAW